MNRPAANAPTAGPRSEAAASGGYDARVTATVVRIASRNSRFDWADAGIGAAAMLGLTLVAGGSTFLLAHRRTRQHAAS